MKIDKWKKLYHNNIYLDNIFKEKYKSDNKLFEKNEIELLVEIGEFINETKVFKYWSVKTSNKEKMLLEYADVITMILSFYHGLNMDIKDVKFDILETDLLVLFKKIYNLVLNFIDSNLEITLEELFKYVLYVGKKLDFKEDEILNAIENKHKIIEERLNSDY